MIVTYQDRNGKAWRFDVAATPYQTGLFRRVLSAVRSVGQREALTLAYLANVDDNDAFLSDVEAAVLSALSERFAPQEQAPPPPQPPDDETEERPPYYWELF